MPAKQLSASQKNTYTLKVGECQVGKGVEMYHDLQKGWAQGGMAPILMTKNDKSEVGRHARDTAIFNEYSARIWTLAGLR